MSNISVIDPRPNLTAGARPTAIVPQTMDEAYRLAKAVCMAGMAPKGLETPEKAMVAILHGLEIGLTPMAALQRIAVVNGRPTIWGDGAIGLVRGSGACDWIRETIAGESDAMTATCQAKRKGEPEPIVGTFSVADAKKAGLWGKGGPWQQFPKRMLQMRARAFALRDGFADVLGGLYLREEIEEAPPRSAPPAPPAPQTAPPAPQTAPPPTPVAETPRRALTPPNPNKAASEPPPPAQSASINFDAFRSSIRAAATQDDANAIYDREVTNRTPSLHPDELDEADAILRDECAKFWSEEA